MRLQITTLLMAGIALAAQAQTQQKDTTLNRTVVVEQEYNPVIMDARKVNTLPQVEELTVIPKQVEYDAAVVPSTAIPGAPIDAYAAKEQQEQTPMGYARFGYGNYGNLDIKANYLFRISPKDKLNLSFAMDGMNGELDAVQQGEKKWDHHYYQSRGGLDYMHQFSQTDMNIGGNFGVTNFNFLPADKISRQNYTSGDVYLKFISTDKNLPLQFNAGTNLLLYTRNYDLTEFDGLKETILRTHADVSGAINDDQRVGIYGELENIFFDSDEYSNYTKLAFNPYYTAQGDDWRVRLGARVDLNFSFGDKVQVAPDLLAEYIFSDSYVLYAKATGGTMRNDFRRLEHINPYAMAWNSEGDDQLEDSFEQINASAGFKASPATGLWFNLYGGYQNIKNDLNYHSIFLSEREDLLYSHSSTFFLTDANNVYAGAGFSYEYKNQLNISLDGKYYNWSADEKSALYMKPLFHLNFLTHLSPIPELNISLGYEYIKRDKGHSGEAVDPVSNLSWGATYRLFDAVSVYVRASNLLNKDYHYYVGYPSQGINFLGGVSFRF